LQRDHVRVFAGNQPCNYARSTNEQPASNPKRGSQRTLILAP